HLCAEAHRLGLEVNMNNDPGWCGSGGPWVTPELSMQKVVWTETFRKGPFHFDETLPRPAAFENFYRDVAVLAFPTLEADELHMADFSPTVSVSGASAFDPSLLLDHDPKTSITVPLPSPGKPAFLKLEFPQPYVARELVLDMGLVGDQICHGAFQIADDD